jgi:hypothetical protein
VSVTEIEQSVHLLNSTGTVMSEKLIVAEFVARFPFTYSQVPVIVLSPESTYSIAQTFKTRYSTICWSQ